jgi:hypothetical protein
VLDQRALTFATLGAGKAMPREDEGGTDRSSGSLDSVRAQPGMSLDA